MIKENNISYTPEKIDTFITDIIKDINITDDIYKSVFNKISDTTLREIVENTFDADSYKDKLTKIIDTVSKKYTKYYNIIDAYEVGEEPDNVKKLSKLVDQLDNYYFDLSKMENALDSMISASNEFTNLYNTIK